MTLDPFTDSEHAARQIAACKTHAELDGYEAEAKRRGIAPHEVTLILERRRTLRR
jgi:hypothetical protein